MCIFENFSQKMTLEDLLKIDQSRKNIDQVVALIVPQPELFDQLWQIFLKDLEPQSRRAAWAIDIINEKYPLIQPAHIDQLVEVIQDFRHDGMRRHSLRIIESHQITPKNIEKLTDICFRWLEDNSMPVAIKMYSIKILERIAGEEPEIIRELIDIIEIQMNEATPGFRNIGIKTIRRLQKSIKPEYFR